jgi:hypothetical protein
VAEADQVNLNVHDQEVAAAMAITPSIHNEAAGEHNIVL